MMAELMEREGVLGEEVDEGCRDGVVVSVEYHVSTLQINT